VVRESAEDASTQLPRGPGEDERAQEVVAQAHLVVAEVHQPAPERGAAVSVARKREYSTPFGMTVRG